MVNSRMLKRFREIYNEVINSIAFYPVMISLGFFVIGLIMITLEAHGISRFTKESLALFYIDNIDTGRSLLNTIVGGVISLTVFSFTMVMLIFNQITTNFSPRAIPDIIKQRSHQVTLGVYIGTLVYCIMILINLEPDKEKPFIPGTSIFLGSLFALFCIALFVLFIHSVSQNIQVGSILKTIFIDTKHELRRLIKREKDHGAPPLPDFKDWNSIQSKSNSFIQRVSLSTLRKICDREGFRCLIHMPMGSYINEQYPVVWLEKEVSESIKDEIMDCFTFHPREMVSSNFEFGFKQITEISVKALSPGINDPGTAVNGLDLLSELFVMRLQIADHTCERNAENKPVVYICHMDLEGLMNENLGAIRTYGRNDPLVVLKLLTCYQSMLRFKGLRDSHRKILLEQVVCTLEDADYSLRNRTDRKRINNYLDKIREEGLIDASIANLAMATG